MSNLVNYESSDYEIECLLKSPPQPSELINSFKNLSTGDELVLPLAKYEREIKDNGNFLVLVGKVRTLKEGNSYLLN